ncbi:MAG: alpha/beta fold hydrolase [Acidimicrobiia bacterium]|nr:alpha/beta fold hydrolase [Acidimicrobiia bacterium]
MSLHHEVWGRGQRLVLAHGFTQNRRCWGPFAHDLAADHQVVLADLPGHGATPPEHDRADLTTAGELLVEVGGEGIYVGYSMGGRVALHAALSRPGAVRGLVLIGATAGIDQPDARRARTEADDALAEALDRVGLPAFLDRWLANPLFAGLSEPAACRRERLANRQDGLASSLRHCGTGTQEPLWNRLGEVRIPVLVLVGSDDTKFTELGNRLVAGLPDATLQSLPATHAVHLERPTASASAVRAFLES